MLMLNRSLGFLLELLRGLKDASPKTKSDVIAQNAYDKTLAAHYSWITNKMAALAFNALPSTKVDYSSIPRSSCQPCILLWELLARAPTCLDFAVFKSTREQQGITGITA